MPRQYPHEVIKHMHTFRDRLIAWISAASVLLITLLFLWLVLDIFFKGFAGLHWSFLTSAPLNAGRAGGIAPVIVSTLLILGVCMLVCVPAGLATAIHLSEYTVRNPAAARLIRRSLDTLAGVPSIVFGLFGASVFCDLLGLGYSILSGGLTLACMVLPFMIRAGEESLRSVPQEYRLGASALGFSQYSVLTGILIPVAMPGLSIGLILGIGRALAETAALIFTSGYVLRMPESLLDSGRTLSVHIYDLAMNVSGGEANGYTSALVLIAILVMINTGARILTQRIVHEVHI